MSELAALAPPKRAWLALTGRCNLSCRHCFRSESWLARLAPAVLSPRLFRQLERELFPSLEVCRIGGNNAGEQLLSPHFDEFARRMSRYPFRKVLLTNGTQLTAERIEMLVGEGWSFDFSLEAITPALYQQIRGRDISPLLEAIRGCSRAKQAQPDIGAKIRLSLTIFHENLVELPRVIEAAVDLGVDAVLVHHFLPFSVHHRSQSLVFHQGQANEAFAAARSLAQERGLVLRIPPPFSSEPAGASAAATPPAAAVRWNDRTCFHPWTSISIREDGLVTACCISRTIVGNLHRSSIAEIWSGRRYARLRESVNTAPVDWCVNCPMRGSSYTSGACNDEATILKGLEGRRGDLSPAAFRFFMRHPSARRLLQRSYRHLLRWL